MNNNNYYPPAISYQRYMPSANIKGRFVSSFEEARVAPIDFDGSIFIFPDITNQRIYTKQINLDGTSTINVYLLGEMPIEENKEEDKNFVTRDELYKILAELKEIKNENVRIEEKSIPKRSGAEILPF